MAHARNSLGVRLPCVQCSGRDRGTIQAPARSHLMNDNELQEPPRLLEPLDWVLGLGGAAAAITVLWLSLT